MRMRSWEPSKDFITGLAIYCQWEKDRSAFRYADPTRLTSVMEAAEHAYEEDRLPIPPEDVKCRHLAIAIWIDKARPGIGGSADALAEFAEQMNEFFRAHPDDDEEEEEK